MFIGVLFVYSVTLISTVQQGESVLHVANSFLDCFSHIGHYVVLSRVPCAIQEILVSCVFYTYRRVYVNPNFPIYPPPPTPPP